MSLLDGNGVFLEQLATGKEYRMLLTGQGLDMDRPEQADTHHLRNAAGIIAIALDLALRNAFLCQIAKLKPVKRQMYRRAKIDLLQARLIGVT